MSQPGNSPSPGEEVSPSVALLAACAPDHHQALDLSHFPDCETCLAARDYFINKETTKTHHFARSWASKVAAPELPLGYAPADLRTYRRPRVPGTPDPVQLLLPGRTQPVLPTDTPSPKRNPAPYAPTPLKRKRHLSFQEELRLEREAETEDDESTPLGQPERVRFATQSTPTHQHRFIRQATPIRQDTPSRPDDETRGTSRQICHQHNLDHPDFVPAPYHDPSIWDSAPTVPQPTATSSIHISPFLSSSIHCGQPGATSDIPAQDLKLIHPFGAQGRYVYGLIAPEPIQDPSPSPPPPCGMQFASRICGTAASIGSGAINLFSNAVNTLLGRAAPRHVPVDNAGRVILPDQPIIQAPKRRRVDGSGDPVHQVGEPSSAAQTHRRSGSPTSRRQYGRTTPPPTHTPARRAATASPNRQNDKFSAEAQFVRDVKSATPPHSGRDWMDVDGGSPMDIDEPSLTEIDAPTHHEAPTIKHEQPAHQPVVDETVIEQPTNHEAPTVKPEQPVHQPVDETAIEQSPLEQPTVQQPVIEQPTVQQPVIEIPAIVHIVHDHPYIEHHAVHLNRATVVDDSTREQPQRFTSSSGKRWTPTPEPELAAEQRQASAPIAETSEDEDSDDERAPTRLPRRPDVLRVQGSMRVRAFHSPQERLRLRQRRDKKENQRKQQKKLSPEFGSARVPSRVAQYKDISEFFANDGNHAISGFFTEHPPLVPNNEKLEELERQHQERLRREEEERREAERKAEQERREAERRAEEERRAAERERLRQEQGLRDRQLELLGLRKPNATMITPISAEWNQKVEDARAGRSGKVKTPGPEVLELGARDFERLVPETAWLNDSCVTAALTIAAKYVNDRAGVILKQHTPKCVTLNTFFWAQLCTSGPNGKARMLKRLWGLTPENFLDVETIIVPVNLHSHWSFIIVRPSRREIAYVDSFQHPHEERIEKMHEFLAAFLEARYDADEWQTVSFKVPDQTNSWDCGVFTITNTMYLAMGIDPSGYVQADMPLQRRRIAAAILNGGFTGDFDLSQL